MVALLDLVVRLVAATVELVEAASFGATPLLLPALALVLVTAAAIAAVVAVRGYRGPACPPTPAELGAHDPVCPLVAQSDPDAPGHVRSRAPGAVVPAR